ncbi:hypothetical protein H5P28_05170 [Ruficoccus amylovorans]|uniref:UbiA prenyltransferase family protein n=1 Tax=Ruficoccus amylovorans TaxID=1804625 RepID=A0A842HC53_9BACT|nr:hypothetical protein [Ruficoccus amylovorans]MBC2593648.1 hypothetical protein [Ruficoccus amylovorans]
MGSACAGEKGSGGQLCWWQWPNVLAVDAALIAVIWQQWLGRPGMAAGAVLGLSVWLMYTGDRWLDVRGLPPERILTARHRFARRWAMELLVVWGAVLVAAAVLSVVGLTVAQFSAGVALLGVCVLYSVAVHRHLRVPKELLVALIFAAGTGIFPLTWDHLAFRLDGLAALFLLAFANCSLIAFRELSIDREMGRTSLARQHPASRVWAFRGLVVAFALGVVMAVGASPQYLMVSVCAAGMFALGMGGRRLSPELFRVLADLILLLPGLCLLFNA